MNKINGVYTKSLVRHSDDRGYFMELLRNDDEMFERFGQASMSMSFPGVIKAFHYHQLQDDIWYFPSGHAQVVLHDMRPDSPSYRQTDVYYMGENQPYLLFIPRGVAHGYRVLGGGPATILYFTNLAYDANHPDEYRIAYDDPAIGFDWSTKFR
ncbi:dTDP-4-dehydrorhamnose 3,5-epimerase family protein [Paenibacillus doosanensis]|uniref:dTDP-4-dehydrorhamnose 3,5-epimerase n=1 Tax=Paenibacillus konkukensis TaxID=2020716 RepID=A0ABY4RX92_9BACL|nr:MULTISPECIES: dTDP-4-dehydrorhamnose 3,5-epimerase family protein [Paenibacillus]MCS7458839.1 dTDP-4-dehydrorhamnose 3,5-epimerase family protein [Paenibacillus doosanensis]UQZ86633.1 dTDP-4-dehydrorhamnose 3,5-epimerase [Paenibacillus konkukensis]